jgi:hypothetical protein
LLSPPLQQIAPAQMHINYKALKSFILRVVRRSVYQTIAATKTRLASFLHLNIPFPLEILATSHLQAWQWFLSAKHPLSTNRPSCLIPKLATT